jgi:hypothetical protein
MIERTSAEIMRIGSSRRLLPLALGDITLGFKT